MKYCSSCGNLLGEGASWPIQCASCKATHYRNPACVGVAVIPVHDEHDQFVGVLGVLRGNPHDPGAGKWALPGGFQEWGEDIRQTAWRETREETGIEIAQHDLVVMDTQIVANGGQQLIFVKSKPIDLQLVAKAKPRRGECLDVALLTPQIQLAFPTHQAQVNYLFSQHTRKPHPSTGGRF